MGSEFELKFVVIGFGYVEGREGVEVLRLSGGVWG